MMSTLPRRTAAVTALSVAAFSGVAIAGAAVPASASAKIHTSLSVRSVHAAINPGGGDIVSGVLHAGRGGGVFNHVVELDAKAPGATTWTKVRAHATGRLGRIAFQVTPTLNTRYRLFFNGNANEKASVSGVVVVRIKGKATSLAISAASKSIAPGAGDSISATLGAAGAPIVGGTVKLLSAVGAHTLKATAAGVTGADGTVTFAVAPKSTSHYVVVFPATTANGYARSAVVTVHVLQASSLSIRARAGKNHTEVISGVLRGGGHAIRDVKVELQARPSGTSTWTTYATHRTNGKGGFASFSVPSPTQSADFQLVFLGGPAYNGCQSGVVTVTVA